MPLAKLSDLWTPAIWIQGIREKTATMPSALNAGVAVRSAQLDEIATGGGLTANIPFFKDITDQADEIQVEDTGPTVVNGITSGLQVAPILNRVTKNAVTALAAQVSGSDPVAEIETSLANRRMKQRHTTLVAILRGIFGTGATAANAAGALSGVRLGGVTAERFDETGIDATSAQLMSPDMFIDAESLLAERSDDLSQGAFICHPNIRAALKKLDALNFKDGVPSGQPFTISTYRGIPIFVTSALVRAGTTNGFVYDSYLLSRGCIGWGEKAQAGDTVDAASLSYFEDKDKNNEVIYDRSRFILHPNGMKWIGTPAASSASDAELQTAANWNLVLSSATRAGMVAFRSNG